MMKPFFKGSDVAMQLSEAGYSAVIEWGNPYSVMLERYNVISRKTAIKLLRIGCKNLWCNMELQKYWYSK